MKAPGLRYHEIALEIRTRIQNGTYTFGTTLPSQSALAEEFSTTVMTVRQAIRFLENEGLVESKHGVGSFVTGLSARHRKFQLKSFKQALGDYSQRLETRVIEKLEHADCTQAGEALGVAKEQVCAIKRLRTIDSIPVVFQISYVARKHWEVIRDYQPDSSLYETLNKHLHTVISQASEKVIAIPAAADIAGLLDISSGTACLFSERVSKDASGNPVLFDQAYMRNDLVELSMVRNGNNSEFQYEITERKQ
jgi:GntR family transcriptional regulator